MSSSHHSRRDKSHTFLHSFLKHFKFGSTTEENNEAEIQRMASREQKIFSYETLVSATKNFSAKLGEGGFGPVYKGKLSDGREIAVKKLSQTSNQGKKEFMNEAKLLARVQHRNVVDLLGYCVHGTEKLLVYEYLPHESLDKFLFKPDKREQLDWQRRFGIITGVAKGLLYLHEDAHQCIIHRDIKASNVLLADKWTPKIADFGMARLFPEDQSQVNTRVAGTNGYMAPEYMMHGRLSVKADVFSYGVLVLELITGQRNSSFNLDVEEQNLFDWAYKMYKKGKCLEIVDTTLVSTAITEQVAMCIQLALLCIQGDPQLRPTMRRVVVMLSRKSPHTHMEEPTRPGIPGSRYRRPPRNSGLSSTIGSTSGGVSYSQSSDSSKNGRSSTSTLSRTVTGTSSATAELDTRGKRPMKD
ncbi:cysteine-rich receptor-like protein kinase 43 isoform X2 [Vicia villosa]|uniref:cysteine-rich receptor-like protein kinase 43 isoform X2 n=1 Tax=Vicia villosa TaxID=3911 RepID=UPI00273B0F2D|nr:cysteine-rich receptor-like protein kinase 43 isoform X2 [Vicia villosa]